MTRVARVLIVFGAVLLSMGAARNADAQTSFTLTWTGGYGPGSATLTATQFTTTAYLVNSMCGNQNGTTIGTLIGTTCSGGIVPVTTYGSNDNQIYYPLTPGFGYLDISGLAFTVGGTYYNLWYDNANNIDEYFECMSPNSCTTSNPQIGLTITPLAATPEPGTAFLWLTGIVLMIVTRKRIANLLRLDMGTPISLSPH